MHSEADALCTRDLPAGRDRGGRTASPSWFEARTTGAKALALQGSAEFGVVDGDVGPGAFVLTLGADSPTGAVVFTWPSGPRPEPGVYPLAIDPASGIQALVVTGSPTAPTGAFRARGGTITLTRSRDSFLEGRFEIHATGFEAADPLDEERQLVVRGEFTAAAGSPHQTRTLSAGGR